jgi:hypothetical protein
MIKLAGSFADMSDETKDEEVRARKLEAEVAQTVNGHPGVTRGVAYNALVNALGNVILNYPPKTDRSELARDAGEILALMVDRGLKPLWPKKERGRKKEVTS